jgi:O-antigen/teichoic acid export membrane protein
MTRLFDRLPELRNAIRVARMRPFDTSTPAGRSDERYRRIVLSVVANVVGRAVMMLASLVTIPIALSYLGKEQYGLWATINSFAPWVALVDFGLVASIVNPLAQAHGRDDRHAAREHFATALTLLAGIVAVIAVPAVLVFPHVSWGTLFNASPSLRSGTASASVAVALTAFVVGLPFAIVPQTFAAYQKSYVSIAIAAAGALLSLGLLLAGVKAGAGLPWLIAGVNGATVLSSAAGLGYLIFRSMPWLRPRWHDVTMRSLRRLLASSVPLYLFQLGSVLVNYTQQIIVARRVDLTTVAEFDLLFRIYVLISGLVVLSTSSFIPTFREAFERGDHAWMHRSFWHLVRFRVAAAATASVVSLGAGNFILRTWLRRADFAYGLTTWLVFSVLILVVAWLSSFLELLTVLDRIWPQVALAIAQGAATVAMSWTLTPRFGVLGAMLAMLVPALALSAWILPWLARDVLRASTSERR